MVPPHSQRVSRVRWYSGYSQPASPFAYETITLYGVPSHALLLNSAVPYAVQTPGILLLPVWPLPRSLATTDGISVDFFSSPYLDVSVQAVPYVHLWIQCTLTGLLPAGLPHSEIRGSKSAFDSPRLFADCCVLLRLLVPRHSPCALCSLTLESLWFFGFLLDDNTIVVLGLPFNFIVLPQYLIAFFVQFSRCDRCSFSKQPGGLKWTRTTDLTLIRRAL